MAYNVPQPSIEHSISCRFDIDSNIGLNPQRSISFSVLTLENSEIQKKISNPVFISTWKFLKEGWILIDPHDLQYVLSPNVERIANCTSRSSFKGDKLSLFKSFFSEESWIYLYDKLLERIKLRVGSMKLQKRKISKTDFIHFHAMWLLMQVTKSPLIDTRKKAYVNILKRYSKSHKILGWNKFKFILDALIPIPSELKQYEEILNENYLRNWDLNRVLHVAFDESIFNLQCRLSRCVRAKNVMREWTRPREEKWLNMTDWNKLITSLNPIPKNMIPGKNHQGLMGLNLCVKSEVPRSRSLKVSVNSSTLMDRKTKYRGYLLQSRMRFYEPMDWIGVGMDHINAIKKRVGEDHKLHLVLDARFSSERVFYGLAKENYVTMSMKKNHVFSKLKTSATNSWRVAFNYEKMCVASFWEGPNNQRFKVYTNAFLPRDIQKYQPPQVQLSGRPTLEQLNSNRRNITWPDTIPPLENLLRRDFYQLMRLFDKLNVNDST